MMQKHPVCVIHLNMMQKRSVHVPDLGECLVGIDVSRAIGYVDDNNGRRAIKRHLPQKYMMRFEDVKDVVERHVRSDVPQDDAILLKEPCFYCFLLRCKMPWAKLFMEWAVETVLPQEVRKLALVIEEKDAALALLNDDLENREYENIALQVQRDVYQAQLQRCQNTIIHLRTRYVDHARDPGKDNIIIIVRKHTTSANDKYHDLPYYVARIQRRKRYVKLRWFDRYFPDHYVRTTHML